MREYGAEWLRATGDAERLRRRHRDWYLGLATWCELDWFSPRQAEAAARVDSELPNLRRAMECSMESPEEAHLAQYLAGTLWFYWVGCGRLSEGRHWLDHVLEAESPYDHSRLKALWVLGYVSVLQGDPVGAVSALQECREEGERAGDATAVAYAVHRTGCLSIVTDDPVRAEELLREALGRYREIGELNSNVLMAQVELGMAVAFRGDLEAAAAICGEVREICEDHGERWALAYALYVLGFAALRTGEDGRARRMLGEALSIAHAFHDLLGTVLALELLALVTAVEGDAAEAAVLQGAADRIWPSVGLPLFGSVHYGRPRAECEERARAELGDARYDAQRRSGQPAGREGRGGPGARRRYGYGRGPGGRRERGPGTGGRGRGPRGRRDRGGGRVRGSGGRGDAKARRLPYDREGRARARLRATPGSAGVVLDDELLVADDRDFLAVRVTVQAEGQGLQVHLEVARGLAVRVVATLTGDLEGDLGAAALADLNDVVGAHAERRLVDLATVDLDVAVDDHLAGLVDGAGDARTQDQGVETALELDDQRLARLALGLTGAVVGARHLALADVVLRTQTLLLEQTDLVVRVLLAATAVLARRVGAGFEVLDSLRRQGDAEGTRLLDLGTRLVRHVLQTSVVG